MDPSIPLLDFHNPWVALIQLALTYFLPRLTGFVTSKWAASLTKIIVLGILTVVTSGLTWLLDVAVANSWATVDWTDLVNIVANAALTFGIAQGVFSGIIVKLGQNVTDANRGLNLFANTQRVADAIAASKVSAKATAATARKAAGAPTKAAASKAVGK